MSERVLCVDDDANILEAYKRSLRKDFEILTALSGSEGLTSLRENGPFPVVVSDLRMPEMDGVEFLSQVRQLAPDSVRMMLTGNADLETAIEAVNEGNIFRFLTKPCSPDVFAKVLRAGIRQYELVRAEKTLLEKTLGGTMKILTDVLSMVSPVAFGRANRARRWVNLIAKHLQVEEMWQLEVAAMLCQVGCITVPTKVLEKVFSRDSLLTEERRMFRSHPLIGRDLVTNIPRLENVARIIAYQEKHYNGEGLPNDDCKETDIPLESRILHVALDYDTLVSSGVDAVIAVKRMRQKHGYYDPRILAALETCVECEPIFETKVVSIQELSPGMYLAENVKANTGTVLVTRGQEVTASLCERLRNFSKWMEIREPISVQIPLTETR